MTLSPSGKKLIIIMFIITIIGVIIAYNYYGYINDIEDPRIIHVKEMHLRYNQAVNNNDTDAALTLLDSMDTEYQKIDHYRESFERGVIYTNKASVYITRALYQARDDEEKQLLLDISENDLHHSIEYYNIWKNSIVELDELGLYQKVSDEFADIDSDLKKDIIDKRITDLKYALKEINKRYSVTYTNLGVVMRHKLLQDSAIVFNKKALDHWPENHTAKSNLNVLMGGKPIKRGFIEKMFPPERE